MPKISFGPKPTPKQVPAASPRGSHHETPLFDTLFPCKFRNVYFPVISIGVSMTHDMAEHKYYGVGAANVEMTGRNPRTYEAEIPFVNGILPGKNERWGVLYPDTFRDFIAAMGTTSTGYLDTPELRGLTVKPVSMEYKHEGSTRGGVIVTARWVETVDQKVYSKEEYDPEDHPVRLGALSLDAEYVPTQRMVNLPNQTITFEELANEAEGIIDTASSRLHILANKPAQLLYRVQKIQASIERAANPLTWPGRESCERIEEAVNQLKKFPAKAEAAVVGSPVHRYTARTRLTLSQLALATQNSIDELLQLNPNLASRPAVPAGTVIRYYKHASVLSF